MDGSVQIPFIFNGWKHHKNFVQRKILFFTRAGKISINKLRIELKQIGDSQTDFYYGNLDPAEIAGEIRQILTGQMTYEREDFLFWLGKDKLMFKTIELSDSSNWTLREGMDEIRYIHFHPARASSYTIRIRASTLKTAIAAIVYSGVYSVPAIDIKTINHAREQLLQLPPVKDLRINKSILKIAEMLI